MTRLHEDSVVVDGLQINNWDRSVLEELRAGGVSGVNATCAVWEGPLETLRAVADWYRLAADNADVVALAETADDIRKAKQEQRVAVVLGFQNSSPFADDYRMVEVFARLGVRIAQLTYNIQNLVGGACYEPVDSGLTRFGRTIVGEMNRVGMLVDLSHVGNRTSLDAIECSTVPVAVTHSNPIWFFDHPRNKPDAVLDAVAAQGGVIGCCLYPNVLGGERTTRDQFCRMVARLVDQVGPAHVAVGSDCTRNWGDDYVGWLRNGRWLPPGPQPATWPQWPQWFAGPEDFPTLTEGLQDVGLHDQTIAGILGENWLRLFDQVFAGTENDDRPSR
jgi:microsomal dipeptidase-like Zn-dependent dipeptidase